MFLVIFLNVFLHLSPPVFPFTPHVPLEIGLLMPRQGVWGRAVSSPSGVWGEAPADERLGAYWSQRVQLWWQQFLLIFLRTNVQIHVWDPIPHRAVPYEELFFLGALATIALWKSASMPTGGFAL